MYSIDHRFLKYKEIAYEEFNILHKHSQKGETGEINVAIWKRNQVVIKKVNKHVDPIVCSKNFVHEVSITNMIKTFNI